MRPFVIDANAIHQFQVERISEENGIAHAAIERITRMEAIALDEEQLCLQEWMRCASGSHPYALMDWVSDQLVAGKIVLASLSPNTCRKNLLSVGLPSDDHKWVRLAIGCGGFRLVTNDIDFFDPAHKNSKAAVKTRLKSSRKGKCAKMLEKTYKVSVMCFEHVADELV